MQAAGRGFDPKLRAEDLPIPTLIALWRSTVAAHARLFEHWESALAEAFEARTVAELRGAPYDLSLEEIARRTREAWDRGATEICLQGGIHPDYTGQTYLDIVQCVKAAAPEIHVHAFSPLEVWQGAQTLGMPLERFLDRLRQAGLASLPGTAAEVLDDRPLTLKHVLNDRANARVIVGHEDPSVLQLSDDACGDRSHVEGFPFQAWEDGSKGL